MTATFSESLTTDLDWMRWAVGDTNVAAALRSDEQYAAVLTMVTDRRLAAAAMAESLAAEYAQKPDAISDEGTSISWRERVKTWLVLAAKLRSEVTVDLIAAGGGFSSATPTRAAATTAEYVRREGNWVWP